MKTINDLINHVLPMLEYEVHALKVVVVDESIIGIDGIDGDTTITLERRGSDPSWHSWIDVTITAQSFNYEAMLAQSDTCMDKVVLAEFTIQEDPTETLPYHLPPAQQPTQRAGRQTLVGSAAPNPQS